MNRPERVDVVVYLSTDWESSSPRHRGHFGDVGLLRALAELPGIRILCVNQPVTPVETPPLKWGKARAWLRGDRLRALQDSLFLLTPAAFVHEMVAMHSPLLLRLNRWAVGKQVRACLRGLGFVAPVRIAWIYHPLHYPYFGLAGEVKKVYKAWDLYRIRRSGQWWSSAINAYEQRILEEVDIVLTPCTNLHRELRLQRGRAHFTPPGVDIAHFRGAARGKLPEPRDMVAIRRPRIGFTGDITERVDLSLIGFLAESRPDWSVVLVGNVAANRTFRANPDLVRCQHLPNVHFLGFREFSLLPAYIGHLDVCLLAHSRIEAMRYGHPYKTLQYLAAGKPVVSTDIPDAAYYAEVIRIARDPADFLACVERALCEEDPRGIEKRLAFAERNTWRCRAQETYDILVAEVSDGSRAGSPNRAK